MRSLLSSLAATLVLATGAIADVRLPALFSDGLVLQRDTTVPLWGWARPGEVVVVRPSWSKDEKPQATTQPDGRWEVQLTTASAGGPHTISITGDTTVTIRDVLMGEVWLASGQSNMEWPISLASDPDAAVASATSANIRIFDVKNTLSLHPRQDAEGRWNTATGERVRSMSAVAFHFASNLSAELKVPVGIVAADWGGTRVEAWMPRELLTGPRYTQEHADIRALQDPSTRAALQGRGEEGWWFALDTVGPSPIGNEWRTLAYDTSSWESMTLPATLAADGLDRFDGLVYFVRDLELTAAWDGAPATLNLGPIDDRDETFVNSTLVGATRADGLWNQPRSYKVPAGVLKTGRNRIAVRLYDTAGPGGINGPTDSMRLNIDGVKIGPVPLAGEWKYRVGPRASELPAVRAAFEPSANTIGALYDGMIRPLVPMRFGGVIWYQGESNLGNPDEYARLFTTMIDRWRADFRAQEPGRELPFLFVQIAPYGYRNDRGEAAELRDAQDWVSREVPRAGMIPTLDIGDPTDIHPKDKKTVGERLAKLAMGIAYSDAAAGLAFPRAESFTFANGVARVTFSHADTLKPAKHGVENVWVAGADKKFFLATKVDLKDGTLEASHPQVPSPTAIRYAWEKSCAATLWNNLDNPVPPFRSDTWKLGEWTLDDESFIAPLRSTDADFTPLFNGKDLTGWTRVNVDESTFTAVQTKDAGPVIHCTGKPTGLLRTDRMYENYELELEFRHLQRGGNAGVFVHSDALPALGVPFSRSIEVQVMDGLEGNGYTSDGDIFHIWGATMTPENSRGGKSRAFPTERRMHPSPRWNHYRIVSNQGDITLAVNGKVVSRGRECSPRNGYICLEAEGAPVDFRNLRIRQLAPSKVGGGELTRDAAYDPGFVPLFGGVDLDEWDVKDAHKGHWKVNDSVLSFDGQGEDLWTKKSYRDFVLTADWRWTAKSVPTQRPVILPDGSEQKGPDGKVVMQEVQDAGDSGIYLRGSSKNQVNLWCWPAGSGEIYGYRTDAAQPPEVRAACTPKIVADNPPGQWNRIQITMKGDRVSVVLNGKQVITDALLPGIAAEGPIALQKHDSPIEFTNILIKELKD
jgi:sialate O-acetylesterase